MSAPLRALVVDDESHARRRLIRFMAQEPGLELAGEAADGLEAVEAVERLKPDLVFLDVQMPELDGFGVVAAVGAERMPATLFVTAYDHHALAAFEANAVDYLLKPFDEARFLKAMARVRTWLGQGLRPLVPSAQAPPGDRILVRAGESRRLVRLEDVQWVEAEGNYVRLHVAGGSHLVRGSMQGIQVRLGSARFRRIHRSSLVNLDYVDQLQPWFGGDYLVLMRDGTRLTLSRTHRSALADLL